MKTRARLMAFCASVSFLVAPISTTAADEAQPSSTAPASLPVPVAHANATNRFDIRGMHCGGCASGIRSELKLVKGVVTADVSFPKRLAVVAYDTNLVSQTQLVKVIHEAGYEAVPVAGKKGRTR